MTDGRLITAGALAGLILSIHNSKSYGENSKSYGSGSKASDQPVMGIYSDFDWFFSGLPPLLMELLPPDSYLVIGVSIDQNWPDSWDHEFWRFAIDPYHPFGDRDTSPYEMGDLVSNELRFLVNWLTALDEGGFIRPNLKNMIIKRNIGPLLRSGIASLIEDKGWDLGQFLAHFGPNVLDIIEHEEDFGSGMMTAIERFE